MTCKELQYAIITTMTKIREIEEKILVTTDVKEKHKLKRAKKELKYLQGWQCDILQRSTDES